MRSEKLTKVPEKLIDVSSVGRPKTRKIKAGEPAQISITVDGAVIIALDREAERMSAERPGLRLTRANVVRVALHEWLAERSKQRGDK